jgi:hypothetical protein
MKSLGLIRLGAVAASMLTIVGAHPALAQDSGGQAVRVDTCRAAFISKGTIAPALEVAYQNQRQVPADRVDIAVTYGPTTRIVTESGLFSPGVEIDHTLYSFDRYLAVAPFTRCSVVSAHFTDGSVRQAAQVTR